MAKSFKNLKAGLSPEAAEQADRLTQNMMQDMALQELRQAKNMSQEYLAGLLHMKQANISRIEKRADMYISTLRNYVKALGGELDIIARFPEAQIRIQQFQEI